MDYFDKIKSTVKQSLFVGIKQGLIKAKQLIEDKTPEDTKKLLGSYEIINPTVDGNNITGKVINDTEYSFYVENGVMGKTYRYNKPKGNIFRVGVGAKMMKRTAIEDFNEIKEIIGNEIKINVTEKGTK